MRVVRLLGARAAPDGLRSDVTRHPLPVLAQYELVLHSDKLLSRFKTHCADIRVPSEDVEYNYVAEEAYASRVPESGPYDMSTFCTFSS